MPDRTETGTEIVDDPRKVILEAAADGLAEHGYDRVRLRDIAHEAGFSIGLIQHYFDTREELLNQAYAYSSDTLVERWRDLKATEHDPWGRIVAMVDELARDPRLRPHCIRWGEFCVVAARRPQLATEVQRVYDIWRDNLKDAIEAGTESGAFTPQLPLPDVVELLLAAVDGFELELAAGIAELDGLRMRDVVLSTARFLLGLTSESPPASRSRGSRKRPGRNPTPRSEPSDARQPPGAGSGPTTPRSGGVGAGAFGSAGS